MKIKGLGSTFIKIMGKSIENIAIITLVVLISLAFLLRLRPGNTDDKTLLFSTSSLGFLKPDYSQRKEQLREASLKQCKDERCRFRTSERITAFSNYPLYSFATALIYKILPSKNMLKRISLTYSIGFLCFFVFSIFLLSFLAFRERGEGNNLALIFLFVTFIYSGLFAYRDFFTEILATVFTNANQGAYTPVIYVPRGSQSFVFVICIYAFIKNHKNLLLSLIPVVGLLHAGQAPFFLLAIFAVVVAYLYKFESERSYYRGVVVSLVFWGFATVFWTLRFYQSTDARAVFENFDPTGYFSVNILKRLILFFAIVLPFLLSSKNKSQYRVIFTGIQFFFFAEIFHFFADGVNNGFDNVSTLEQIPYRIGTSLYVVLAALAIFSVVNFLNLSRIKVNSSILVSALTLMIIYNSRYPLFYQNLKTNFYGLSGDLEASFEKYGYTVEDIGKVSLLNPRPKDEILFHLFMFNYYDSRRAKD